MVERTETITVSDVKLTSWKDDHYLKVVGIADGELSRASVPVEKGDVARIMETLPKARRKPMRAVIDHGRRKDGTTYKLPAELLYEAKPGEWKYL